MVPALAVEHSASAVRRKVAHMCGVQCSKCVLTNIDKLKLIRGGGMPMRKGKGLLKESSTPRGIG